MRKPLAEKVSEISLWQLRAARAAIGVSAPELALLSGLSANTVRRAENGYWAQMSRVNQRALLGALEAAGVRFFVDDEGQPALAYRQPDSVSPGDESTT